MTPVAIGLPQELALLAIGVLAGLAGGLLGIGGGIVMIPALWLIFGDAWGTDSFHVYNVASIATAVVLSIPAAIRHTRAKAVIYPMLIGMVPLALVGVAGGTFVASQLVGDYTRTLKQTFGVFLELVVVISAFQEWRTARGEPHLCNACPLPSRRAFLGLVVGLPSGFIAGLLGVGGGIWTVPVQSLLLGIRLRYAIATSTLMIIAVAVLTAVLRSADLARLPSGTPLHHVAWWLALWLSPGALVGGWCGADLTHRLPVRWLRYLFLLLLAATGVRMVAG